MGLANGSYGEEDGYYGESEAGRGGESESGS